MGTALWRSTTARQKFWTESEQIFAKYDASPATVTDFFKVSKVPEFV